MSTGTRSDAAAGVEAVTKLTNGTGTQQKVLSDDYYRSKFSVMAKNRAHDGSEYDICSCVRGEGTLIGFPSPSSSPVRIDARLNLPSRRETTRLDVPVHLNQLRRQRSYRAKQGDPSDAHS